MKKIFLLLLLIFSIIFIFSYFQVFLSLFSKAAPQKADILIDVKNTLGPVKRVWSGLAQGGEEPPPMLNGITSLLKPLNPQYIRIDHIYDYYQIVKSNNGKIEYDFNLLDQTVEDIIKSGALPFFSLSYMPQLLTTSGSVIDKPRDWQDWQNLVTATIEHYSGKTNKNLHNIYYEVWNEPELPQFGKFSLTDDKDYRLLYFYAAKGAEKAENVNHFYLGGPAVGSYYRNWVTDFVSYVNQNNLRLDFYSWHRYHKNIEMFRTDAEKIRKNLASFPKFANLPLFLTEWGMESENKDINNSNAAASFTLAAIANFYNDIDLSFVFEIKDGPPPNGGKWGLVTHENSIDPLKPKPRYKAFEYLSRLNGNKLSLAGNGTYVNGFAAKSDKVIRVLLANYDPSDKNFENVPVTFAGLEPFIYQLKYSYPLEDNYGTFSVPSTNGTLEKSFIMKPNSLLYLELSPSSPIPEFITGKSGKENDQALVLSSVNPLIFSSPKFSSPPSGLISFDFKPLWPEDQSLTMFELPLTVTDNSIQKLSLSKTSNSLRFGLNGDAISFIDYPVSKWQNDKWYHLNLSWNQNELKMSFENHPEVVKTLITTISNGQNLTFFPTALALDNLKIVIGENPLIGRFFNGKVNR